MEQLQKQIDELKRKVEELSNYSLIPESVIEAITQRQVIDLGTATTANVSVVGGGGGTVVVPIVSGAIKFVYKGVVRELLYK